MLRLVSCGCGTQYLVRMERSWWMRALPGRRYYFCTQCRNRLFMRKLPLASPATVRSMPQPLAERQGRSWDAGTATGPFHGETANPRD